MAVIKCKMCGGDLILSEDFVIAECAYCGSIQTVPKVDDERKLVQFERAERLRKQCEFDKAAGIYETIVADFRQEAEAYWGLVLCKYGIEYVDDPATGKKIPTCHRSSFDSIMEDSDFEQALENADVLARRVYRDEAKVIEEIRKGIISVSASEDPYDIFICYKETDQKGDRTLDSVLAQDIYDALTEKGYRVFFSRISLEDKLGLEYEPYIFAALNSAKIMLVVGTDYEYFNAVWVKNEWSRYLKLMAKDKEKHLVPCYKNVDAYDMPKEFIKLQAQDLGKLGAMQDLLRGVEKLLPQSVAQQAAPQQTAMSSVLEPLLKRAYIFLEDGDWANANSYCEKILDMDPECGRAYLIKLMSAFRVRKVEQLAELNISLEDNLFFQRAMQFSDDNLRQTLMNCVGEAIRQREEARVIREQLAEEARIAREKQAEEVRLAREKKAEEARLAKEKREEEERIANENAEKLVPIRNEWKVAQGRLVVREGHAVAVRADSTVMAVGMNYDGRCDVSDWKDVVAVSAGPYHTVGLKLDGTVQCVGDKDHGRGNTAGWQNVVAVAAGRKCSVGLHADGTVVFVGVGEDISGWIDVAAIDASDDIVVGLKSDGTVSVAGDFKCVQPDGTVNIAGDFRYVHSNTKDWRNIVAVSAGGHHIVGLQYNGMVIVTGDNFYGQCNVNDWRECVAIGAGSYHTVALKADGTVLAVGLNDCGQCDVDDWQDIVAVYAGDQYTVGVQSNGMVVVQGEGDFVDEMRKWRLFQDLKELISNDNISQEYIKRRNIGVCQHCGGTFKGVFSKTCSVCGKPKDY